MTCREGTTKGMPETKADLSEVYSTRTKEVSQEKSLKQNSEET